MGAPLGQTAAPMTLVVVFGTRPEAIKLGPVVSELRAAGVSPVLLCTGQHTTLLRGTPAETDLATARSLGITSDGNILRWCALAEPKLQSSLSEIGAQTVVVQGDTMSAMAGANAAAALGLTLCHVEAGVRSHDPQNPWPEEGFRTEIARLADWHYAPTSTAFANLVAEGVAPAKIRVTGNPGVSALARYTEAVPVMPAYDSTLLVTMHRREWLRTNQVGPVVRAFIDCANAFPNVKYIWPIHPAVEAALAAQTEKDVTFPPNMLVCEPMPYPQIAKGLSYCAGVLTDSGGLQEEAATLGVPCAVMRHVTDRPESIEAGVARLFPPTPEGVRDAVATLLACKIPRKPVGCFGDTTAAAQIARHLMSLPRGTTCLPCSL